MADELERIYRGEQFLYQLPSTEGVKKLLIEKGYIAWSANRRFWKYTKTGGNDGKRKTKSNERFNVAFITNNGEQNISAIPIIDVQLFRFQRSLIWPCRSKYCFVERIWNCI